MSDEEQRRKLMAVLIGARKELGIRPTELARRTGISTSSLRAIENGAREPRVSTLQRYARGIGLAVRFEVESDGEGL